jgi:diguanylate cyclase (GGDEF)-like protein/PAS domain S-box-containing protein
MVDDVSDAARANGSPDLTAALLESCGRTALVLDRGGRIVVATEAVARRAGLEGATALGGRSCFEVLPWLERGEHRDALEGALAGSATTTRAVLEEGVAELEWRLLPLAAGGAVLLVVHGVAQTTAEGPASEPHYKTLVEGLPGIVYRRILHPDGRLTVPYLSPRAATTTGLPLAELVAEPTALLARCVPEDVPVFMSAVTASAETLQPHEVDVRVEAKDGDIRWLRNLGNPTRTGDGAVIWDGIILDITPLKEREAALAAAEERFREITLGGSDWAWETDAEGRYTYLSERFTEITGIPAADVLGRTRTDVYAADHDDPTWREHIGELAAHQPFRERIFDVLEDGQRRHFRVSGVPVFDGAAFRGYRGVATEITQQVEIQERLRESEARFRDVAQASSDWIWEMDATLRFTFLSERYTEATGIPVEEILGRGRQELMAEVNPEELIAAHAADLDARRPFRHFRYAYVDGQGARRFQVISGLPTFDAAGNFTGYRGTGADVTDQVRAELQLQESEARFRDVAEASSDWIWEMDAELRFTFLSARLAEVTGIEPGYMLGRTRAEVASTSNDPDHWYSHLEDLAARRPFREFRYCFRMPTGRDRHMMISGVPVFAAEGTFQGYRGTGTDITAQVEAERLATDRKVLLEQAVEALAHGFALFDEQDRLTLWNKRYAQALGLENLIQGTPFADLVAKAIGAGLRSERVNDPTAFAALLMRLHREADGQPEEFMLPDGRWITSSKTRLDNGCRVTVQVDITEMKRREQALREGETRYRELADATFEGILVHRDGAIIDANKAFLDLTGHGTREAVLGRTLDAFFEPSGVITDPGAGRGIDEVTLHRVDGSTAPVEVQRKTVPYKGQPVGVIAMRDLSERRRAEARIRHLAHHDPLTGLPNRTLFGERLARALDGRRGQEWRTAILQLDLDNFKDVNDALGHHAGDFLLQKVAERLRECVRDTDTVARLGGDEFAILLAGLPRGPDAAQMAQRIVDRLRDPVEYQGHTIYPGTSIGVTVYPDDDRDPEQLLKNADIALYRAKSNGRNTYSFFISTMKVEVEQRRALEGELRRAIGSREFRLLYQPQVDLRDGRVTGIEALLRWQHPERGTLAPGAFLSIAEETGLIVPIGQMAMVEACRAARGWLDQGLDFGRIAINMASAQFKMGRLARTVRDVLRQCDLPPDRLEIEITEGVFLDRGNEGVADTLRRLARMNVRIAHLKRFPLHRLKIDQSFIRDIGTDPEGAAIVRTILSLGAALGLEVVAEGVETPQQQRFLAEHACHVAQGYLFSRPIEANEVALFLESSLDHGCIAEPGAMLAIEPV